MTKFLADLDFTTDIKTPGGYQGSGSDVDSYTAGAENLISNALGVLTIIAGLSFMIYFLIGGLTWITAGGKSDKVEQAKDMMTNGAIGIIIVVVSYSIIWIIGEALGIKILEPASLINNNTFKF